MVLPYGDLIFAICADHRAYLRRYNSFTHFIRRRKTIKLSRYFLLISRRADARVTMIESIKKNIDAFVGELKKLYFNDLVSVIMYGSLVSGEQAQGVESGGGCGEGSSGGVRILTF